MTTETTKTVPHNIMSQAKALGAKAAEGIDSIVDLAELVFNAAQKNELDTETSKLVYDAYATSANDADTAIKIAVNKDSLKNSYSRLNVFVRLAKCGVPAGWTKAYQAIAVRQKIKAERDKMLGKTNTRALSTYSSLVEVARSMVGDANNGAKTFDDVDEKYIRDIITPDAVDNSYAAIVAREAAAFDRRSLDVKTYPNKIDRDRFAAIAKSMREMTAQVLIPQAA